MVRGDLAGLERLVEAGFARDRQALQRHLAEEGRLRGALAQLDEMERAARAETATGLRLVGADLAWQAWLGRRRRALNMALARCLAQKEGHLRQAQRGFGRVRAVAGLAAAARVKGVRQERLAAEETLRGQMLAARMGLRDRG